jgi:hypothetical protein
MSCKKVDCGLSVQRIEVNSNKRKTFYTSNNALISSSPVINVALDFMCIYIACRLQYTLKQYIQYLKSKFLQTFDFWFSHQTATKPTLAPYL